MRKRLLCRWITRSNFVSWCAKFHAVTTIGEEYKRSVSQAPEWTRLLEAIRYLQPDTILPFQSHTCSSWFSTHQSFFLVYVTPSTCMQSYRYAYSFCIVSDYCCYRDLHLTSLICHYQSSHCSSSLESSFSFSEFWNWRSALKVRHTLVIIILTKTSATIYIPQMLTLS